MTGRRASREPAGRAGHAPSHKVRSALTILGIVIGVTSVISVAAIIDGLNGYIQNNVESFGSRTYFVSRIPLGPRFGRLPEKIRMRKYLEDTDAEFLRDCVPIGRFRYDVRHAAFFFGRQQRYSLRRKCGGADHPSRRGAGVRRRHSAVHGAHGPLHLAVSTRSIRGTSSCLGAAIADSLFPDSIRSAKSCG